MLDSDLAALQVEPSKVQSKLQETDDLLHCLLWLARENQVLASKETLLAGLPLVNTHLTPSLFQRAAKRIGFSTNLVTRNVSELNPALFPAILILKNNRACLLTALDINTNKVTLRYPELPDSEVIMTLDDLAMVYQGRTIYVKPEHVKSSTQSTQKIERGHWFWGVIAAHKYLYRDVLIAAFLINIFALAMPLFIMNIYDRVVPNHATDTLWVLAAGITLVLIADAVLKVMRAFFVDLAASRADVEISTSIMERVLGIKLAERPSSVGSFSAGLQAFESVRHFIGSATVVSFIDLPFIILFTLVIGIIAWPLVIPVIVGVVFVLLYTAAVQHQMHRLSESSMQASGERNAVLVESLSGIETLKSLGAEGRMQRLWEKSTEWVTTISVKTRLLSSSVLAGSGFVQQFVAVMVIIVGVYQIIEGNLTQGGLIAAYMLSSRVMGPISQAAALLMQYHQAATALMSLDQLMQKPLERPAHKVWVSRPRLSGSVEFKQVTFGYPQDEREILRGVTFKINAGEKVAILGRNGSGKSTLQKLVAGLYSPTNGSVLIDGIDISQIDPAQLRANLGYVSQEVNLFQGTLRDNILLGHPDVTDERLIDVVETSGVAAFANTHPYGLAMQVGEHGALLSGGQRQTVGVARALLSDPPLYLFDEPTGSMDHASEDDFKKTMREILPGKTLMVITHRTSLLDMVDRIIVIDAGKIVADGARDQVIEALRQGRIGRAS